MSEEIFKVRIAGFTDTGLKRQINEDHIDFDQDLGIAVLADGMGGHAGGALASRTCVDVIERVIDGSYDSLYTSSPENAGAMVNELLGVAASEASAKIYDRALAEVAFHR